MEQAAIEVRNAASNLKPRRWIFAIRSSRHAHFIKFLIGVLLVAGALDSARSQTAALGLTSPDFSDPGHLPFSFRYDGKESTRLLTAWRVSSVTADESGQIHRYSYVDPVTDLKVIAEVRLYPDYPDVVDWVLKFRNDGPSDTPVIEDILPLHWAIPSSSGDALVRHDRGSANSADDFEPLEEHLDKDEGVQLKSSDGRPSGGNTLPFFNLETGDHGVVGAIGWTGNWKADFNSGSDRKTIVMTAGMIRTHLVLHPGEEIRTPRIVLMSWTGGDWNSAQNAWRRLLFAHYTRQEKGKPMMGPVLFGSWGSEPIDDKIAYIRWVHDHRIPMDVYAVDAGWYGDSVGAEMDSTNPWWKNRGDWFPSPRYYPNGIKPLGDALKAAGFGFSLWVEPETSMSNRKIIQDHPDWYLHSAQRVGNGAFLVNLGDPAARKGITDMVSGFISDFGMTWYRQDFNMPSQPFWELADTPDRVGMREIRHVEGLYAMWDELLERHPGLRIDNCASGGRRIDIEMMSRSYIVWRTDHGFLDTLAEQAQTQALAPWAPQNMALESYTQSKPWNTPGPYSTSKNLYLMRLGYNTGYGVIPGAAGVQNEAWVSWIKQAIAEYREVQPYFYGDFYPLLSYSRSADTWTAWQWDRPAAKDGLVIVLRRPKSPFTAMELLLQHLNSDATYDVEIRSTYKKRRRTKMKGRDLAHLQIHLTDAPSSTLVFYHRR